MIDQTLTTPLLRWWSLRAAKRRAPVRGAERPPSIPGARQERWASRLFRALSPRLGPGTPPPAPPELAPNDHGWIERRTRPGRLSATFYPADAARGVVILAHPWMSWCQGYFHRRGRIEALRAVGYHALSFDFGGVGKSDPPLGFYSRDVADVVAWSRERFGELPIHFWGVSFGGYWAHLALSGEGGEGVLGAVFEDVSPHLLEWSQRMAPWGMPGYLAFRWLLPEAYRYLDLRRHAPHLRLAAAAYLSGSDDPGIWPHETRELARLAGAEHTIVEGAGHLGAIKRATRRVVAQALATFERAERS